MGNHNNRNRMMYASLGEAAQWRAARRMAGESHTSCPVRSRNEKILCMSESRATTKHPRTHERVTMKANH